MFGLDDFLLGGLTPAAVAAAAFGISWAATRREGVAWNVGVTVGYAAGATALAARNVGAGEALQSIITPSVAPQWLPLMALVAAAPLAIATLSRRRWVQWALAAPVCIATPVWLLRGGKYLPSQEVRESGFATAAWSLPQAAVILGGVAVALLTTWWLWQAIPRATALRTRSLLTVLAMIAAAAAIGLTGSFTYAQLSGVLAAAVGGCAVVAGALKAESGPEAAAGPIILLPGLLLLLAACYSALPLWLAVSLAIVMALAAGWLPGLARLKPRVQLAVRTTACLLPLAIVLWQASVAFIETQRQQQEAAESNPYLNL